MRQPRVGASVGKGANDFAHGRADRLGGRRCHWLSFPAQRGFGLEAGRGIGSLRVVSLGFKVEVTSFESTLPCIAKGQSLRGDGGRGGALAGSSGLGGFLRLFGIQEHFKRPRNLVTLKGLSPQ